VTGILGRFQTQGGIHPSLSTNGPQVVNNDNAVKFNGIFKKMLPIYYYKDVHVAR
jgi:hypothetical protein